MGCGSSKGIAPAPAEPHATTATSTTSLSPLKTHQELGSTEATDVAKLHKERLEQPHQAQQQQQHHDMGLPGRIESTTAPAPALLKELSEAEDLPPPRKDPADAEFDYDKELLHSAAMGGMCAGPDSRQQPSPAQGAVVGGLLSKQPDWLRGNNASGSAAAEGVVAAASAADAGTQAAAKLPSAPAAAAGPKASSLPPLIGRGLANPTSNSNSLPPLLAPGTRALAPVAAQHRQQPADSKQGAAAACDDSSTGSPVPSAGHSLRGSLAQATESSTAAQEAPASRVSPRASAQQHHAEDFTSSHCSIDKTSTSSGTAPAALPAANAAAVVPGHLSSADPWSSLQSQYANAGGPPSPDSSISGGSPTVAAAAAAASSVAHAAQHKDRDAPPAAAAAAGFASAAGTTGPQGSRRVTANAAAAAHSQELVLVDSDDEGTGGAHEIPLQQSAASQLKSQLPSTGTRSNRSSFNSGAGGKISVQSSSHSVSSSVPHVAKSGGWGVGSLAGAGTVMLGETASSSRIAARKPGMQAAATHDDVFGDEAEEAPILPRHLAGVATEASSSGSLRASHSRMRVGASAGVQDTLDVEEIEDEMDALIASEMAQDGLPADLASKLAQFEALGAEDEGSEAGGGGGSGAESEGPSIFELMNHRQGSWRAA